jgi:Ca2+-transporting ATPase
VTKGKGLAVVTTVVSQKASEMGKIYKMIEKASEKSKTPLQKMLKSLAKNLSIVAVVLAVVIPFIAWLGGMKVSDAILSGLSLAFATIPEELPILIKAVLAVGSLRLSRKNLLIKDLHAAEIAGTATTILTDKTGTLTKNELQLSHLVVGSLSADIAKFSVDKRPNEDFIFLLQTWYDFGIMALTFEGFILLLCHCLTANSIPWLQIHLTRPL